MATKTATMTFHVDVVGEVDEGNGGGNGEEREVGREAWNPLMNVYS